MNKISLILFSSIVIFGGFYFGSSYFTQAVYDSGNNNATSTKKLLSSGVVVEDMFAEQKENLVASAQNVAVSHIKTPKQVKAIYMSACVAATPSFRSKLKKIAMETEINSIMIDVKDYTGTVSFISENKNVNAYSGRGCIVKDMKEFVEELHKENIYVIARITVFQDPYYTKLHPEDAVKKLSDGSVWKDKKGLSFVDVGVKKYWEQVVLLGKESHSIGFDELNFDYIRFPSDGNMKDISFTHIKNKTKSEAVNEFFEYLSSNFTGTGIVTSADLFGMTTTNTDDLNIGQILEHALSNFDYVAPMVYPSHYPPNFNGWKNPNNHPYDIIKFSMTRAVERAKVLGVDPLKLRPWLQDFDYGGNYGPKEVRYQIQATYDSGLDSWMLWDPSNKYTREALKNEN